jgi:hypothetical protein
MSAACAGVGPVNGRRIARRHIVFVAGLLAAAGTLQGQGIRLSGVTSAQWVELRPLLIDSVGAERSGARINSAPFLQDLTLTAWGFAEGLSFHSNVRARTQLGSDELVYPGWNDHFDVLDAYAQLDRSKVRARLGRQWITGGLGVYDFDGGDVLLRSSQMSFEAWGGRALAAGLFDTYLTADLAAAESRPPEQNGWVYGGRARFRPSSGHSAALMYQRVIAGDRSVLYSERAAFDGSLRKFGAQMDLALAYDFAADQWNDARIRVGTAGLRTWGVSGEVRHSMPFFELWTIWGAFSPVGYDEARATVDWRPSGSRISASAHGGYRKYADAAADLSLRSNGWRAGADVNWLGGGAFSALASYDIDIGFGASRSDGRLRLAWRKSDRLSLGFDGSALQNIYEFQIGTGRVYGAAFDGNVQILDDVRLALDAGVYRHVGSNGAVGPDWTQRRASIRLEWTLGRDPGAAKGRKP